MSKLDELDVVVRRRGSTIIAGIPEAQLYASAADLESALAKLDEKKEDAPRRTHCSGRA